MGVEEHLCQEQQPKFLQIAMELSIVKFGHKWLAQCRKKNFYNIQSWLWKFATHPHAQFSPSWLNWLWLLARNFHGLQSIFTVFASCHFIMLFFVATFRGMVVTPGTSNLKKNYLEQNNKQTVIFNLMAKTCIDMHGFNRLA